MKTKSAKKGAKDGVSAAKNATIAPKPPREAERSIPPKWLWHYRALLRLRGKLMQDTTEKFHEAADPIERHSIHLADSATDEFDHDLALAVLARQENALSEVNDAITRILEGKYGVCEETGVRIPSRRLRAIPWCRYARAVEDQLEKTGTVTRAIIPEAVSLRGRKKDVPGTGEVTPEGTEGEPREGTPAGEGKAVRTLLNPDSSDAATGDAAEKSASSKTAR